MPAEKPLGKYDPRRDARWDGRGLVPITRRYLKNAWTCFRGTQVSLFEYWGLMGWQRPPEEKPPAKRVVPRQQRVS